LTWNSTRSSLLARLRGPRDEGAWRRFDRLYGEVIVRYARRRGLSLADAEDVRQNVLVSMVSVMPRFEYRRDRGRFRSYLGRAVGNAIERQRHRAHVVRERPIDDHELAAIPADDSGPDPGFERDWVDHHLRRALDELRRTTSDQSLKVFDRLLGGATPEAVATELGLTLAAVRKARQRVRQRLEVLVRRQIEDEDASGAPAGS
jgi:RNA polymerase sigma factor (sigma-70 family)